VASSGFCGDRRGDGPRGRNLACSSGSASAGTISGTFYKDPNSQVLRWLAANPATRGAASSATASASSRRADGSQRQPVDDHVGRDSYVAGANAANQIPLLVALRDPEPRLRGASAGGTTDLNAYANWVRAFASGLGTRTGGRPAGARLAGPAVLFGRCRDRRRDNAWPARLTTISMADPAAKVYLDAGHRRVELGTATGHRRSAASARRRLYSNVSNFRTHRRRGQATAATCSRIGGRTCTRSSTPAAAARPNGA